MSDDFWATPPEEARDLDRLFRGLEFRPRESLEPELTGRSRTSGEPDPAPRRRWITPLAAACVLGAAAVAGWYERRVTTVDWCCGDLDGGGIADDGIVVMARRDESIRRLALYEDRDRSRSLSAADIVRFERGAAIALAGNLPPQSVTLRHCCADYDGGGPPDDGILVVGVPPDTVLMVGLYERRKGAPESRALLR